MSRICSGCDCGDAGATAVHAVIEALLADDLDRAIDLGLMTVAPCPGCSPACRGKLTDARAARERALAARERFRNRQARLQRLAEERRERREKTATASQPAPGRTRPPLPDAAAAALARARARAAERGR
nr:hypothetical protein [Lysobacter alkalisoli]